MFKVSYRRKGQWFWKTVEVKGDAVQSFLGQWHLLLIKPDESQIAIPIPETEFRFSKERHYQIIKQMEQQAGQKLPVNSGV